jgi:hypothetical protein
LPTDQAWHVRNLINFMLIHTTSDREEGSARSTRNIRSTFPALCGVAAKPEKNFRRKRQSPRRRVLKAI